VAIPERIKLPLPASLPFGLSLSPRALALIFHKIHPDIAPRPIGEIVILSRL
jgi:hypothetical protein